MNNNFYKLILPIVTIVSMVSISTPKVFADCETTYGGGETCIYNKRFSIEKKVRFEGDSEWEDKIEDVDEGDVIEFRLKIKNLSDDDADEFDNMKMHDSLPDELIRVGGSGLTEYWDNFDSDETQTYIIRVVVDEDEFDRTDNFENCVVNKAKLYWDDEFEGSDTATVCYGKGTPSELPDTGANAVIALAGLGTTLFGLILRKTARLTK